MDLNQITEKIIKTMGPGLLESAYEECLCYELAKAGLRFQRQVDLPVLYHEAQLLTYLKMKNLRLGLLINFNVPVLKDGIKRIVNNL